MTELFFLTILNAVLIALFLYIVYLMTKSE